jgi:hypothetical protein
MHDCIARNSVTAQIEQYTIRDWHLIQAHGLTTFWPDSHNQGCACTARSRCTQPGKHPVHTWKERREPLSLRSLLRSRDQYISRTGFEPNWAVVLGRSNLAALDIDQHDGGPDGKSSFAALIAEHGELPHTPQDSRGHYLFQLPDDAAANKWPTKIEIAPGVELFTGDPMGERPDHILYIPPSDHKDGNAYQWLNGCAPWEVELAVFPQWIINRGNELAAARANQQTDTRELQTTASTRVFSGGYHTPADSTVIERARAYVSHIPGAISGQRGSDRTFHVACVLVIDFALPVSDALPIMREWNATCLPQWNDAELIHKLNGASQRPDVRGKLLNTDRRRNDELDFELTLAVPSHAGPRRLCNCNQCREQQLVDMADTPAAAAAPLPTTTAALPSIDDLCSPAAGRIADQAAAERAERVSAATVAAELHRMRYAAFQCPSARRIIQQHRTKRETAIFWGRCDRWDCPACSNLHRKQWQETISLRILAVEPTADEDGAAIPPTIYAARVDRKQWTKIQRRMGRKSANYYRFATDGPTGTDPFVVFTDTADILDNATAFSPDEAIRRLSTALNLYHEPSRPITSSNGWGIPKRESQQTGQSLYRRIGMVHKNITDADIEHIAERVNTIIEDREVPRSSRNRIYRVRSFLHRPEWSSADIDMFHWFLLNGVKPEPGWAGDTTDDWTFDFDSTTTDRVHGRNEQVSPDFSPQPYDLADV